MTEQIKTEISGAIATVSLNRPDKYNGLTIEMIHGLNDAAKKIGKNKSVRAVILRGEGDAFCSGLDFKSAGKTPAKVINAFIKRPIRTRNAFQDCVMCWRDLPVPVIAAIQGYCFGGGLQIALGADFRFATPDSTWSILEIKWGLIPDMAGTVMFRELMPMDLAKELTMTGRQFSGEAAKEYNLVTHLADDPLVAAQTLAEDLITKSPDALAACKALFHGNWNDDTSGALARERSVQLKMLMSKNQKRAVKAGLAGKQAEFGDRQFG